jgi:hypothetical protein
MLPKSQYMMLFVERKKKILGISAVPSTTYFLCHMNKTFTSRLSAFAAAATVATLGDDIKNHLARLFAAVLGTDNLDSLILGLVARYLDLGACLLAEVVDGAASRSDDEPIMCQNCLIKMKRFANLPVASWVGQDEVASRRRLRGSLDGTLKLLAGLG